MGLKKINNSLLIVGLSAFFDKAHVETPENSSKFSLFFTDSLRFKKCLVLKKYEKKAVVYTPVRDCS